MMNRLGFVEALTADRRRQTANAPHPRSVVCRPRSRTRFLAGLGIGAALGYLTYQAAWIVWQLKRRTAQQTLATHENHGGGGRTFETVEDAGAYTIHHTVEDGIERVVYTPKKRRFETPILMQHGMWHGAWCWAEWQALLATWGWESHAHSLPGHAGSPAQRALPLCTLDYYLGFLKAEVERLPRLPVLMGHSMGGALTQWYLKYVADDLPAAVLVAPWVSHSMVKDGILGMLRLDPWLYPLMSLSWDAAPFVRTPARAARALISPDARYSPEALHARLGPESALVLLQHNPPFWTPPGRVQTPLLWLAGECDTMLSEAVERRSAAHYAAEYHVIEGAGHNVMMERNYRETAALIHEWLLAQGVP